MQFINVDIRPMTKEDLPAVMDIENQCFVAPWKEQDFLNEMENKLANLWVVELGAEGMAKLVVGFSDYWQTFDSATICQIAIHPEIRRRQLGSALMDEIINDCYAKRVRTITLEVRKSNQIAINFYKKHGFSESLIKEKYYSNGEDAIYMMRGVDLNG